MMRDSSFAPIEDLPHGGGFLKVSARQAQDPSLPTIVILGGLLADQLEAGSRSGVVADLCVELGLGCVRFNYSAHGTTPATASSGLFKDVSVTRLLHDAIAVCLAKSRRDVAFVGSSLGAGLMPYLASALVEHGRGTVGVFGISSVLPVALQAFVTAQVNAEDAADFERGAPVTITSPTLPTSIRIRKAQIADLEQLPPPAAPKLSPGRARFICGEDDPLSSEIHNQALASAFGLDLSSVHVVQKGHDIDKRVMADHLRPWLRRMAAK
jgi:hypothetical protein